MERRMALMGVQNKARLPAEYQEIEWLKNYYYPGSGNKIDYTIATNQRATYKTGLRIIAAIEPSTNTEGLIAMRPSNTGPNNAIVISPFSSAPDIGFGFFGTWYHGINRDDQFHEYVASNEILSIDGVTYGTPNVSSGDTTRDIYLFGLYGADMLTAQSHRLKYAAISQSGVIVAKLYPCYRKSDGKNGFYNTIDNAFLTCVGSQLFTRGPDVT